MIGGERNGPAVPAKYGPRITAVGDDNLLRRDYCDNSCRSHRIALRRLELAPAIRSHHTFVPSDNLFVHPREASLHQALPLLRRGFLFTFQLFLYQLMQPFSASRRHLKEFNNLKTGYRQAQKRKQIPTI